MGSRSGCIQEQQYRSSRQQQYIQQQYMSQLAKLPPARYLQLARTHRCGSYPNNLIRAFHLQYYVTLRLAKGSPLQALELQSNIEVDMKMIEDTELRATA